MTATAYMKYIMGLKGPVNKGENARAKEFMQKIAEAQIQNLRTSLAMGKEYADARHAFEEVFKKFGFHDGVASVIFGDRSVHDISVHTRFSLIKRTNSSKAHQLFP